ncbi:hypothetical protein CsSME_00050903 [Camellia sinensis var. sinensis]
MFSVRAEVGPRHRILFLGGRSFEFQEEAVDQRGHRCLGIVECGSGLRREVILVGFEVNVRTQSFLGHLDGRSRSVVI